MTSPADFRATGLFVSFEQPVRQSILYHLVPRGSALFGPSIGGMLIPYIDTQGCFFAAAIGNLVVLVSIFTMRIPKVARRMSPSKLSQDMLEGLSLAWTKALFLSLFTLLAIVPFRTKPYTELCQFSHAISYT